MLETKLRNQDVASHRSGKVSISGSQHRRFHSTLKAPLRPIETIDETDEIMLIDNKGHRLDLNAQ